mmetsp:Transcript_3222/g.4763  ORF Transcript_3222/g.4763 Transcript_3222/m.4763 type:complete len:186 (-) Transcript_3222:823-1380(-)
MDSNLKYACPVVLLNTAFPKSKWKGMLLVTSVLTPMDQVLPIAFAISVDCEDSDNWKWLLLYSLEACPNIQHKHEDESMISNKTIFVSDCDKGLQPVLDGVFPNDHSTNYAVRIQRNVKAKFGQQASSKVVEIAKTFSSIKEETLFGLVERINKNALTCIQAIEPSKWRSTQWAQKGNLPPVMVL